MLSVDFHDASGVPHSVIELRPHDVDYLQQIVDIPAERKVHPFGTESVEQLIEYRVGGPGFVKSAFAAVNNRTNRVSSVIFGHKTKKPIHNGADLQGDVASILLEKAVTPFTGHSTANVFYEISSIPRAGTGGMLIRQLLKKMQGQSATISPFRFLVEAYPAMANASLSDEETMVLSFLHLLTCKDGVQVFHMKNGAIIRDIKLNANTPQSQDGTRGFRVMINYGYSSKIDTLENNRAKLTAITNGDKPEALIELMEFHLVERVMRLIEKAVLKHLYPANLADNLKSAVDARMRPAMI